MSMKKLLVCLTLALAVCSAVFALAVGFIVLGVLNGGLEDVMTKANAICMECVGRG